jgi:hypothetical protein
LQKHTDFGAGWVYALIMALGEELKRAREAADMTQEQVAVAAGIESERLRASRTACTQPEDLGWARGSAQRLGSARVPRGVEPQEGEAARSAGSAEVPWVLDLAKAPAGRGQVMERADQVSAAAPGAQVSAAAPGALVSATEQADQVAAKDSAEEQNSTEALGLK